ncbi:MAG: hypothetical protein ACPGPD_13430 [Pseudomonadales bacterium]
MGTVRTQDEGAVRLVELLGGDANQEALAAFMEKRGTDFSGL